MKINYTPLNNSLDINKSYNKLFEMSICYNFYFIVKWDLIVLHGGLYADSKII